uniref:HMG box domain-containing protein n=1 Tax=Aegilops tauschii subsp. strangulata TaxID=200361 RepID=A0A453P988_AEGTS
CRLKAAGGASKRKKDAAAAGKPKRPPSAFFVFMSEFRQQYNAENPNNKSVANVSHLALFSFHFYLRLCRHLKLLLPC